MPCAFTQYLVLYRVVIVGFVVFQNLMRPNTYHDSSQNIYAKSREQKMAEAEEELEYVIPCADILPSLPFRVFCAHMCHIHRVGEIRGLTTCPIMRAELVEDTCRTRMQLSKARWFECSALEKHALISLCLLLLNRP